MLTVLDSILFKTEILMKNVTFLIQHSINTLVLVDLNIIVQPPPR